MKKTLIDLIKKPANLFMVGDALIHESVYVDARKSDGSLVIMELGDGQVSGLQQSSPAKFYSEI